MSLDQSERSKWSREQAQNLILHVFSHNYHNYSMFRDVPECSKFPILSTVGPAHIDFKEVAFKKVYLVYQQFTFKSMVIHLKIPLVKLTIHVS